ncbi:MAG: hypothetical protein ACR2OZ_15030 [Verrucomicrobiales bacterium]
MRRTERWEGVGPYIWGNRLMQDEKTRELRLWYIGYDFNGNFYRWGYSTSRDGLDWHKPDLGLERIDGASAKNCLPLGPHPEKGTRSIARDPRPDTPPHRRYLGVRFTYDGEFVSFSPDGISWHEHPANPVWLVPSDIIHVMWDEPRRRFTAYFKIWEVAGVEVQTADAAAKPFITHMPWFNVKKAADGKAEFDGPCVEFRSNAAADVVKKKFVLRAGNQGLDDGGGTSLSGAWTAKRVQCWASSEDGIHWTNEQVVLRADDRDPPTANIQFMFVMRYGNYYLGFPTLHDENGTFRLQFAWSADGLQWRRPSRAPWLDIGPPGAFDCGMVLGPADPIFWEKEMWFPYGGFPIRHDSQNRNWESATGLATTRLDGFAAWQADSEGELVTQPFVCNGEMLFINANAERGSVGVEVLENGKPVEGFDPQASRRLTGDTLDPKSDGGVQWIGRPDISLLKDKTIQLRFVLKEASLFSFRIADKQTEKLPAPRATTW